MSADTERASTETPGEGNTPQLLDGMRVIIVAGVAAGVAFVGIGSRLAMMALRFTSPDHVRGIQSDDDFTIGKFTIGGTYNLLIIGAAVGMIGAMAYQGVARWLIGPTWFRRLTVGLASGAVGGSMLVHGDGIDFRLLKPMWLAIGLFVALPMLFGAMIGPIVDAVDRPDSWTARGSRQFFLPGVAIVCFPFTLVVVPLVVVFVGLRVLGLGFPYATLWFGVPGVLWAGFAVYYCCRGPKAAE